eukprot:UN14304
MSELTSSTHYCKTLVEVALT